ncbi:YihY/virulence factor BrkB family protein [Corynebacterium guangdongense]|uniref:Membrane protein n=1 Tax=Corynebacterium guangdongense TaxID=1783348 RepID=A0ABU1ZYA5_9CORY|nr:YihY/virulence factor BrkB family protein [Corynebacterium guangdongense]MDR7329911.1 membrane protein [Corynebacterium guangdongense]WJZ18469.1 Ribonuclease BN-like family protein [Corynebacterium guangdongense]
MTVRKKTRLTFGDRRYILRRAFLSFWLGPGIDNGAKLTFFSILAFAPTILAIYAIGTLILANNWALVIQTTGDFIATYVPPDYRNLAGDVVEMVVGTRTEGLISLVISVAVSLFSASGYVRAFARTANQAYGVTEGRNPVRLWGSMVLVTAVQIIGVVAVIAALTVNEPLVETLLRPVAGPLGIQGAVNFLTENFLPVWAWLRWPVMVVIIVLLIDVLYFFTPNLRAPRIRWLSTGSAFATTGIAAVGAVFFVYLRYFTGLSPYGVLGSVLAVIFTLWAMNIIVVFGLMIDVESERVRQLRQGHAFESEFDLPLRGRKGVEFQDRVRTSLVEQARDIRTSMEGQPAGKREGGEPRG